jgi:hypothetical protein
LYEKGLNIQFAATFTRQSPNRQNTCVWDGCTRHGRIGSGCGGSFRFVEKRLVKQTHFFLLRLKRQTMHTVERSQKIGSFAGQRFGKVRLIGRHRLIFESRRFRWWDQIERFLRRRSLSGWGRRWWRWRLRVGVRRRQRGYAGR